MSDLRQVTVDLAVAPQIVPSEVPALASRFVLIVNNRPDGETADQPRSEDIAAAAGAAGVRYLHIPVAGLPRPDQISEMHSAVQAAGGPVLAFCRSGTRSIITWAAGEVAAGRPLHEVEALGRQAGYEVAAPVQALLTGLSA